MTGQNTRSHNSTLAIDWVSSPLDSFGAAESFVLRIIISGKITPVVNLHTFFAF